ncbi:heme o synthase [Mechercharimyces sp. CAU 1602]|uniref:heme o synthase n=1 Tax=Mechercharimyces sp. CAU 1602 TaxID=2973933 RepID=UPI002161A469|nr:heme o synthase [Mechercharimyces sp. CAU 1602]MCS1352754.1 heme o synthase [Mechercharimyces sp. CAU 1602]
MERPLIQDSTTPLLASEGVGKKGETGLIADLWTLTKPGINVSNSFAMLTGFWLAGPGFQDIGLLLFTLLGTALVIAGGCTLNNFIDRDIDPLMDRTRTRPIPGGRITPALAFWFGTLCTVLGLSVLVILVNPMAAMLSLVGFVVYVFIYSLWLKRTTTLNTVVGSISGAVPPMIGWVALTGTLDLPAWILFLIMFLWQPPHFFAIAMRKVDDYRAAGIPMLPVVKGFKETKWQTLGFVLLLVPASLMLFFTGVVSWIYLTVAGVLGLFYIIFAVQGIFTNDDQGWARKMFIYSLIYLTGLQIVMLIDATGPFSS